MKFSDLIGIMLRATQLDEDGPACLPAVTPPTVVVSIRRKSMAFMIVGLIAFLAAIGAAIWLGIDARRHRASQQLAAVGAIDLFSGLLTLGLMALHLTAVVGRAASGKGFGGEERFVYDFRFFSLLLLGVVVIIPGLVFVMDARRLTEGDPRAWKRAIWAGGVLLLLNIPLVNLDAIALDPALLATINLISLWAGRKQFVCAQPA